MTDIIHGMPPTVYLDGASDGRVIVADSLSYFEHEPWLDDVAVGASFAGAPIAAMPMRQGVKAWIAHAGGPGKEDAGISGLAFADRFLVPAAAIATMTARLSGGMSLMTGTVGHVNKCATALGVRVGQTGGEAARLMLKAAKGRALDLTGLIDEKIHTVLRSSKGDIKAVWSFSRVEEAHPNDVFCVASHGGKVMAQYALRVRPRGVIANDAGLGLDNSGVDGLSLLDRHRIFAAAVSTNSACIGDALSTYRDGVISTVNQSAAAIGIRAGMRARDAAVAMMSGSVST